MCSATMKLALFVWQFACAKSKQVMSVWTHTLYMHKEGAGCVLCSQLKLALFLWQFA